MFVLEKFLRHFWIHIHILSLIMISLNVASPNKSVGTDVKQWSTSSVNISGKGISPSAKPQKTPISITKINSSDLPIKFPTKGMTTKGTTVNTFSSVTESILRSGAVTGAEKSCKDKIGGTLCNNIENYPTDDIVRILKNSSIVETFQRYFLNDSVDDDIKTKFEDVSFDTSQPICATKENTYTPRGAMNKYSQLKPIIQGDGQFSQIIRVEVCTEENQPCRLVDRPGYETRCVQKYILRKLVYLTEKKELEIGDFSIPSCCSCRFTEVDVQSQSRSGLVTLPKCPPVPNSGR